MKAFSVCARLLLIAATAAAISAASAPGQSGRGPGNTPRGPASTLNRASTPAKAPDEEGFTPSLLSSSRNIQSVHGPSNRLARQPTPLDASRLLRRPPHGFIASQATLPAAGVLSSPGPHADPHLERARTHTKAWAH